MAQLHNAVRAFFVWGCFCVACSRPSHDLPSAAVAIVLKHQPLWGEGAPFHAFLDRFRRDNPDVGLGTEILPNSSGVARGMVPTALEGGAPAFDLFARARVWAPGLAR